ncbi:major facilitator superfamily domain-containing protein [Melanogaster broomeanus]|nr:major facilitator superfamily domain-containing protein [Melanogaster broomeanus]
MSVDLERTALLENQDANLGNDVCQDPQDIYSRFNYRQRRSILALVAFAGLTPMLVFKSFIPSIPQVAKDLDTDDAAVNLAIGMGAFVGAVSALFWASHSSVYGRRLMYLWGIPVLCAGSIGVALSTSLSSLFFWRLVQASGCSSRLALGCGVVGDIYPLEERGAALGLFWGIVLLGSMAFPAVGGINKGRVPARPRFIFVNPFKSLWLLRSPNLLLTNTVAGMGMATEFVFMVPIAHTIGKKYNITSEEIIGACFLPYSIGNFLGAPVAGRLSDIVVQAWRQKREGEWVPEDRLRASYIGTLIMVPLSLVGFGLVTTYVEGTVGLVLSLTFFFTGGFGIDFIVTTVNSYGVDLVHSQSAEITAAGNAFRGIILAVGISLVLPSIQHFGILTTYVITALLTLVGHGIIHLVITFGDRMRAFVDVGYTTASNM